MSSSLVAAAVATSSSDDDYFYPPDVLTCPGKDVKGGKSSASSCSSSGVESMTPATAGTSSSVVSSSSASQANAVGQWLKFLQVCQKFCYGDSSDKSRYLYLWLHGKQTKMVQFCLKIVRFGNQFDATWGIYSLPDLWLQKVRELKYVWAPETWNSDTFELHKSTNTFQRPVLLCHWRPQPKCAFSLKRFNKI